MIYLLDSMVSFCTTNATMQNVDTGDELHLPPTAAFILTLLITHHGEILSREVFFDTAWKESGFKLSGNTLNQYISLLRKNFLLLGLDKEIIITVPRMGFCFSETVVIKGEQEDVKPKLMKYKFGFRNISISIFILLLFSQGFWLIKRNSMDDIYQTVSIGKIKTCDVYSSHNLAKGYASKANKIIAELAEMYLPCIKNEVFVFDTSGSLLFLNNGRVFLSRCDISSDGKAFTACQEVLVYKKIPNESQFP